MQSASPRNWVARTRRFLVAETIEHCDFCSAALPPRHVHLIERASRKFFCACSGCAFSLGASERYRLVSPRNEKLNNFRLGDAQWSALQAPVDLVFFFHSSPHRRTIAMYPGPAGATESQLSLETWSQLVADNPSLGDLEPDVEALLVNRARGARDVYRVSIDRCYLLVGLIRQKWRGLSGGGEVWDAIEAFFEALRLGRPLEGGALHG